MSPHENVETLSTDQEHPPQASPEPAAVAPREEYERRLKERRRSLAQRQRIEKTISISRLAVMSVLVVVAWLSLQSRLFSPAWASIPLVVFAGLVVAHRRILSSALQAERSASFYEDGLARLDDRWVGRGKSGSAYLDNDHLYTPDLDIFGSGSLFELLATTRTRAGDDRLASWLRNPADRATIERRQAMVGELRERLDFRERLSSVGSDVAEGTDGEELIAWAEADLGSQPALVRALLVLMAAAQILGVLGWAALGWGPTLLLALLLVHALLGLAWRRRIQQSTQGASGAGRDLALLGKVLSLVEAEDFQDEGLRSLQQELLTDLTSPAQRIGRLRTLVDLADSTRNPIFVPFAILLVWMPQIALAMDAWRSSTGRRVSRWLAVAGEVEALAALASYAYENPQNPFPEIVEGASPILDGEQLGHPLLPRASCVCNDIQLDRGRRALVISGSNMSGKSTYLRTVGVNTVLALAGAPVRASRLRLSSLRVGASIQINDSLQDGHSRFYREILRVRDILRLAEDQQPTLFLLDEILHGTNSHDRRIGADAILRSLLSRRAIGLVTTHDLALAQLCDDEDVAAVNVHFEDEIREGKMVFDYKLRAGVVEKSNAIELMREVGLEV